MNQLSGCLQQEMCNFRCSIIMMLAAPVWQDIAQELRQALLSRQQGRRKLQCIVAIPAADWTHLSVDLMYGLSQCCCLEAACHHCTQHAVQVSTCIGVPPLDDGGGGQGLGGAHNILRGRGQQ